MTIPSIPRYTLIEIDEGTLELEAHPSLGWTIHCDITAWSLSLYKKFLVIWEGVLQDLEDLGVVELFVYAHEEEAYKFANMFGFAPTGVVAITSSGTELPVWRYQI